MRIDIHYIIAGRLMRILLRIIPILIAISGVAFAYNCYVVDVSANNKQVEVTQPVKPKPPTPEELLDSALTSRKNHKIDSLVAHAHQRWGFQGSVLVSRNHKLVYKGAVGTANFATGEEIKTNSVFQLASVSKQFTAMAVMILRQNGELDYDDKVTQYIPDFPYKTITVRQLLNHTSGLPNYMWLVEHKWKGDRDPYNDDVLKLMAKEKLPLYFTPGRRFDYSNTGYMVLASIVEKVSGQRFGDYLKEHVFDPLGMENTLVYCTGLNEVLPDNSVKGYEKRWRKYREFGEDPNNGTVGDKNVYSTVEDMFLWDRALDSELLVCSETLNEAFKPGKVRRREVPYGFGFRLKNTKKENLVYHNGLWNGFRTAFIRDLGNGATLILFNNTNSKSKTTVVNKIMDIMQEEENLKLEDFLDDNSPEQDDPLAHNS